MRPVPLGADGPFRLPLGSRQAPRAAGLTERAEGTLVLIGGATTAPGEALARFVALSGAAHGRRVFGLTTASADPAGAASLWRRDLAACGARDVFIPIVLGRDHAMNESLAQQAREADAIFLGGGDQVKLVTVLSGTPLERAIKEAYVRGAVVCGTSAGAAALTCTTLAGGEVDEEGNLVEMHIGPGLGLLGFDAVIDTHFTQRRRLHRLFVAIAGFPALLGLGIDEDTALVVRGHTGEVHGAGAVTFVDGRAIRFDNYDEIAHGRELTLSAMRVGLVGTGKQFDLRARELAMLVGDS